MINKFKCESVRLCRFLYGLGFDKESRLDIDGKEYWLFERSPELQDSLDFFFYMRKQLKDKNYKQEQMKNEYKDMQKMWGNICP
jgi:hypothetical protein